jgi:hypothetical protein
LAVATGVCEFLFRRERPAAIDIEKSNERNERIAAIAHASIAHGLFWM